MTKYNEQPSAEEAADSSIDSRPRYRRKRSEARPHLPRRVHSILRKRASRFVAELQEDATLGRYARDDPRAFRTDLVTAVKNELPLKVGRRGDPGMDQMCELLRRGKSVTEILRQQSHG